MKQTPKEKATELIYKFGVFSRHLAIKLAIICVDEIIKANPTEHSAWENTSTELYWQQVKEELQKM